MAQPNSADKYMYFILKPGKLLSECSELPNLTEFLICVLLDSLHMPVHIVLFYRTVPVGLCCGLINCKCCEYRCMEVSSWESRILNQYSSGLNHSNLRIQCYSQTMKLNACYCVYGRLYTLYIIIYINLKLNYSNFECIEFNTILFLLTLRCIKGFN